MIPNDVRIIDGQDVVCTTKGEEDSNVFGDTQIDKANGTNVLTISGLITVDIAA